MRVTTERVKEIIEERQMYDRLHPEDIGVEGEKEDLAKDLLEAWKLLKEIGALTVARQRSWSDIAQDTANIWKLVDDYFLEEE